MSRAARHLIEAIQHTLLGPLFWRLLWPNAFLGGVLVQGFARDQKSFEMTVSVITIWLLTALVAWLLGAVARPAYRSLDLLSPSNGFEVWARTPPGGLRPPAPFRFVLRLATVWPKRWNPFGVAVALACVGVIWLISAFSDQAGRLHPILSDRQLQLTVVVVALALVILIDLTAWAREQAAKLAPA